MREKDGEERESDVVNTRQGRRGDEVREERRPERGKRRGRGVLIGT